MSVLHPIEKLPKQIHLSCGSGALGALFLSVNRGAHGVVCCCFVLVIKTRVNSLIELFNDLLIAQLTHQLSLNVTHLLWFVSGGEPQPGHCLFVTAEVFGQYL